MGSFKTTLSDLKDSWTATRQEDNLCMMASMTNLGKSDPNKCLDVMIQFKKTENVQLGGETSVACCTIPTYEPTYMFESAAKVVGVTDWFKGRATKLEQHQNAQKLGQTGETAKRELEGCIFNDKNLKKKYLGAGDGGKGGKESESFFEKRTRTGRGVWPFGSSSKEVGFLGWSCSWGERILGEKLT